MIVTIEDRGTSLSDRLRDRLATAANLRCNEHGAPIVSVRIMGRENGWFDSTWVACCEGLTRQAEAIVKDRC